MPERETTFVRHARQVLGDGKPREALQIVQSWLPLSPDDAGAWEVALQAHIELEDLNEAERAAREIVRLRPESAEAWCDLHDVLDRRGKQGEALEALHRARSIDPELERALAGREERREDHSLAEETAPEETPAPPERATATKPPPPPSPPEDATPTESPPAPDDPGPGTLPPPPPPPPATNASPSGRSDTATQKRVAGRSDRPGEGWRGEPLGEPEPAGWKVRTPEGAVHGPYAMEELEHHLLEGTISRNWDARFEKGRITTVGEALGPERCSELLRQRTEKLAAVRASAQPAREMEPPPPPLDSDLTRCPHCGQLAVTAEKKSASGARLVVLVLGLLFLPIWLLLLFIKDRMQFRCGSCGAQWTSNI